MDLALTINGWIDEEVIFAQQLGARHVFALVDNSQGTSSGWDAQSLARLRNRIEKAGLILAGLHAAGAPAGERGQQESMAETAHLVEAAGAARIGLLSLSAAMFPARRFSANLNPNLLAPLGEAAARAGVKLAIPAAALWKEQPDGRAQVSPVMPESLLHNLPPSAGLDGSPDLLLGWLQKSASGSNLSQLFQDRLYLVSSDHERGARPLPGAEFEELLSVCWRLRQAGYPGLVRLGQPSRWKGDTHENHHSRAFSAGYLRAVLQAFQRVSALS
jgi:hypothetical protein